jgi:hypothetical protein
MICWLKRKIAWAVAGRDLAELERWRVECDQLLRWLAEFRDVCDALDHLGRTARGYENPEFITVLRDHMRRRRDAPREVTIPPINMTPKAVDEFTRQWRAAYGAMPLFSLKTTPLADLRSASALDAVDQHMASIRVFENSLFADPPAPTHLEGIFPVPAQS